MDLDVMETELRTGDGLSIYDLGIDIDIEARMVAGPPGYPVTYLDPQHLPPGFRPVDCDEWQQAWYVAKKPDYGDMETETRFAEHEFTANLAAIGGISEREAYKVFLFYKRLNLLRLNARTRPCRIEPRHTDLLAAVVIRKALKNKW